MKKVIFATLAALAMSVFFGAAPRPALAQDKARDPVASCAELARADFSGLPDAPTHITQTEVVAATGGAPAYCKVNGFIELHVGIEMRLPVKTWNGKFMEKGCGGWCGAIMDWACVDALNRGYACITTDMGHKGSSMDDVSWAKNNLQAQIDFGFRATHVAALAGKAIATQYYGLAPKRSYLVGCSTGGYQGVMEAQRFPWDFDGIVAGAPDIDESQANFRALWVAKVERDQHGGLILGQRDLVLLHNAALALCDQDDGVKDGIIGNPLGCEFKPQTLLCEPGGTTGCLTREQVDAARRIYSGPVTATGRQTSTGSFLIGSELGWSNLWSTQSLVDYFRYGLAGYATKAGFKDTDFDFNRDYQRFGLAPQYDNRNPDLRRLKAAGTKFIIYHGTTDTIDPPGPVIDYYDTVEKTMGGRANTQSFFRLFLIPGMNHCGGGTGALDVDWIGALEAWVEAGKAPDVIIGAHIAQDEQRRYTRPLYPFPDFARYKGIGDVDQAESFMRASSAADH
jgi:feruloyl esterase